MTDIPPTPPETLRRARAIARAAGLRYVYVGNVHDEDGQTTTCARCARPLIGRDWYAITHFALKDGACAHCGHPLPGRFGAEPVAPALRLPPPACDAFDATRAAAGAPRAKQRQPRGIYLLFGVEMWERFSFYGMRAFLVLFAADATRGGLGWSQASAQPPDELLRAGRATRFPCWAAGSPIASSGTHRTMVIGACIIAAGHFTLALPWLPTFFLGLALVAIGTGFFKTNASTMVGQLYQQGDKRRDAGFTIFYMGTNAGAFLGPAHLRLLRREPALGLALGLRRRRASGCWPGLIIYLALKPGTWPASAAPPDRATAAARAVPRAADAARSEIG